MSRITGVFFDQDGVIVDTERDGHRVAFNRTFPEFDLPFQWDEEEYGQLLSVGGGKERLKHYLRHSDREYVPPDRIEDLVTRVHRRKTDVFIALIESGSLPLRPGVRRLMQEINDLGMTLGICTTSNEWAARAIVTTLLGGISIDLVLAGDVVSRKKPDPAIYTMACEHSGLVPAECVAIEDSANGVRAGVAAGLSVIVTVNGYTRSEDHSGAKLVITSLGDPEGELGTLIHGPSDFSFHGVLHAEEIAAVVQ